MFIIGFLISIVGIFILYRISREEKEDILHYLKKLYTIDIVRSEKKIKSFLKILNFILKKIIIYILKIISFIERKMEQLIFRIKRYMRKKLFDKKGNEQVSKYVSEMKK